MLSVFWTEKEKAQPQNHQSRSGPNFTNWRFTLGFRVMSMRWSSGQYSDTLQRARIFPLTKPAVRKMG
jgi:hypothetical protein